MSTELEQNYAGAFDGRLGFGASPALILIDFVRAYFDKSSPLYAGVEQALASALRIRDAARTAGIPVIYTNVLYQKGGANGGVFFRKVPALEAFVEGNPLAGWPDGLEPGDGELVITKQYASAFFGTSLAATLTAGHIDTLIITGVTTSGCIRATCIDTISHGFIPIVVADACGDRHEDPHRANLFDMNAKYADVVDERTVIDHLASGAREVRSL
ncbi:MAG: isochorismatase family protein [Woeseiaceae bacterium]|nr:isochorismatase family protein [Woeseiaceae bacterium]